MTCQGCGNPFCNAGPIMRAWRKTFFYRSVAIAFVPAFLIGALMPIPWSIAAFGILVGAAVAVGKIIAQAFFRNALGDNPAFASTLDSATYRALTGEEHPDVRRVIERQLSDLRAALASGTLNPAEESEVKDAIERLIRVRDGGQPEPEGVEGRL